MRGPAVRTATCSPTRPALSPRPENVAKSPQALGKFTQLEAKRSGRTCVGEYGVIWLDHRRPQRHETMRCSSGRAPLLSTYFKSRRTYGIRRPIASDYGSTMAASRRRLYVYIAQPGRRRRIGRRVCKLPNQRLTSCRDFAVQCSSTVVLDCWIVSSQTYRSVGKPEAPASARASQARRPCTGNDAGNHTVRHALKHDAGTRDIFFRRRSSPYSRVQSPSQCRIIRQSHEW